MSHAKPIIDILIESTENYSWYNFEMQFAGSEIIDAIADEGMHHHGDTRNHGTMAYVFELPDRNKITCSIRTGTKDGDGLVSDLLLFKCYMSEHPSEAAKYVELKMRNAIQANGLSRKDAYLAQKDPVGYGGSHYYQYSEMKWDFVKGVIAKAGELYEPSQ